MNVPVIRLEIQGMKQTILTMLQQEAARIDTSLQQAVEAFCTEGHLEAVIQEEARKQLEGAIREEVRNFFNWSNSGRMAVREAVIQHLNQRYPLNEKSDN